MRPTSEAYKNMMLGPEVRSNMIIEISNGAETITVRDRDILDDSFGTNARAANNQAFTLGTTYAGSFNFSSFKRMRTNVEGSFLTIRPTVSYTVGNSQESFPLGVYRCDAPTAYAKTTSYECYDFMLALDKPVTSRTGGTAYSLLVYICQECGVPMGNTAQEIAAMINSNITLYLDPKWVGTYRDAVSYISIILGGYAIFNGEGRLCIRQFHKTPDRTLSRNRETQQSFAAYVTYFRGVKCRFLAEQNFYTYETYSETREDGVVLDLGDIPIIEEGPTAKQAILDRIFAEIEDIEYTPASISMVGDPSIEPGDMITTKDRDGYDRNIILTSVTYNWHKESEILSEGTNPKLGKVTTAQKRSEQRAENQAVNNTVVTATYRNAEIITLDGTAKEVTNLRFVTNKNVTAIFGAEIPVYSTGDGYITITYDDTGLAGDTVTARVQPGYNLVTLVNHLPFETGRVVNLTLKADAAAIGTGAAPTITIARDSIRSYIFAQGIETEAPWDGIIIISENIQAIRARMETMGLTESIEVTKYTDAEGRFSELIASITAGMSPEQLAESMQIGVFYIDDINYMGEDFRAGDSGVLLL